MKIIALLDEESKSNLELIQKVKGFKTITDVLKYSLQEVASHLEQQAKPSDKMKASLDSDSVGSCETTEDTSDIKLSIKNLTKEVRGGTKAKHQKQVLLDSGYIGSFEGPEDLSTNYKQYLADILDEKYPAE